MNTGFHRDPAGQLIVTTAMLAGIRLATTDEKIIGWAQRNRLLPLADPTAKACRQSVHEDVDHRSMYLRQAHGKVWHGIDPSIGPPREGPVTVLDAGDQAGL